jgi:hypothetical protein
MEQAANVLSNASSRLARAHKFCALLGCSQEQGDVAAAQDHPHSHSNILFQEIGIIDATNSGDFTVGVASFDYGYDRFSDSIMAKLTWDSHLNAEIVRPNENSVDARHGGYRSRVLDSRRIFQSGD